tara:strand:+ start:727 stop:969 length:243 start_codon:yes stop_codon:yes gene_type:complete
MSWEKILKFSDGKFMFNVNAKVTTENEDGDEIDIDERRLHGLAEDVLREMIGKSFSQEFDDDEGKEFTVTCEITSVSENR